MYSMFFTSDVWAFIYNIWMQNKDALFALPTEVKAIIALAIAITIAGSIIRKVWKGAQTAIIIGIIYYVCTLVGIV